MIRFVFILFFMVSCGVTFPENVERTVPEPLLWTELPDPPQDVIEPEKRVVLAVSECVIEGAEPPQMTQPGIYMTRDMAMKAARLGVAYEELRALYEIDIRTVEREREIYERHINAADNEIVLWRNKSKRSWWEKHGPQVMLSIGIVLGVGASVGIAAAIDGVTE